MRREIARAAALDPLQQAAARDSAFQELGKLLLPDDSVTAMDSDLRIAADGELSLVPFGALRSPSDATRRLGETQTITMAPSLMRRRAADSTVANRKWHFVAVSGSERGRRSGPSRATAYINTPQPPRPSFPKT